MQPATSTSAAGRPGTPGRPGGAGWKVRGASAQGDGHVARGTPCQDTFATETIMLRLGQSATEVPVYGLAVADGAGSRRRSAQGASIAVGLAMEQVHALVSVQGPPADAGAVRTLAAQVFDAGVEQFRRVLATFPNTEIADYATTLSVAVICGSLVGVAAVGDGFTIVRTGDRRFHLIDYEPKAGAGVETSATTFLTSDDVAERRRIVALDDPGITGVLMSSDGMANTLLDVQHNQPPKPADDTVSDVMRYLGDAPAATGGGIFDFLVSRDLAEHTRDDKTILLAVR